MSNNQIIYVPIGNAEIVGGVKLKNLELTNQQFFDTLLTRYVSFTLPVSEEKKSSHIQINLYSDRLLTNLIRTIDTTNPQDREIVFGIDQRGFFNIPETGFLSSYQGKPIFVDLQEYYHQTNFISWRVKMSSWGERFYSIFPLTNIDNYGNGGGAETGTGGGGGFQYNGYFAVTDISTFEKDVVNISRGVVFVNNERYDVPTTDFEMIENITGYLIDPGIYDQYIEIIETSSFDNLITGEISDEKLDPSYIIDTTQTEYPCELRLVASVYNGMAKTHYTLSKNNRGQYSTDALIATIDKNEDGSLSITQQQFGELSFNINVEIYRELDSINDLIGV